jgi:hypothetical protein
MNGLENAQHDLSDAQFCLETAIELLSGIDSDTQEQKTELHLVIQQLQSIKGELDISYDRLMEVSAKIELE